MLKIAVFTAWAELQTASATQSYLVEVVKPHVARIVPYWIACLREYAKIRSDPEMDAGGAPGGPGPSINASLDSQYAGLAREVVLPYHESSWNTILQAVTGLLHDNDARALAAMDGETVPAAAGTAVAPKARSEPCLFFFVLYGLAFEALATRSSSSIESLQEGKVMRISLRAMTALSKPQVAGSALLQDTLFSELCNLWYRLVMTELLQCKSRCSRRLEAWLLPMANCYSPQTTKLLLRLASCRTKPSSASACVSLFAFCRMSARHEVR